MVSDKNLTPYDMQAEQALLGAILTDDGVFSEVAIAHTDFYHEPHFIICKVFSDLAKFHTGINQITVADELHRIDKLDYCGGVAYLSHLISACPSTFDAVYYAGIVKRLSIARQLIKAGKEIQEIGLSSPVDMSKALSDCDEKLISVRKSGVASPIVSPKERADLLFARYTELHAKEMVMALRTGIYDLDYFLGGGFYNGDVIIVGARPGVGKTTFLSHLANQVSVTRNVLFCSAEMNIDGISDREVAQIVGVPTNRIRLGNYDSILYSNILEAIGRISEKLIFICDEIPMTTDKILQSALIMKMRHGLGMVVIDYLGMLDDDYGKNSYERVGYISRKIKQLARKLDVPVVVAHQLNRELEKRDDKRPHLFDLRDSGAIEQDADTVLFLYRDSYYDEQKEADGITEIIVAKQRQGDANRVVKVRYDKLKQHYVNMTREELV